MPLYEFLKRLGLVRLNIDEIVAGRFFRKHLFDLVFQIVLEQCDGDEHGQAQSQRQKRASRRCAWTV